MSQRMRFVYEFVFIVLISATFSSSVQAHPKDPPHRCKECCPCPNYYPGQSGSSISLSEGNLREEYHLSTLQSGSGPTIDFSLTYNSYNADGSRTSLDTVMGFGWTHSYNILLFNEGAPQMTRMDGNGRMTAFEPRPDGTFVATTGYFETLSQNPDGTFTLRQKDGTVFDFALIPGTPFDFLGNPIYRPTRIVDRNNNTTTYDYVNGDLTRITDTYGRSLTFTYLGDHKLRTVADPLGRTTTLEYDPSGAAIVRITDPAGRSTSYDYNYTVQMLNKTDRDGRTFTYIYENSRPVAIRDQADDAIFSLNNPLNWETEDGLVRSYIPTTTDLTDGRGNLWRYDYERHGYITQVRAPDGSSATYTYDPATLMVASGTDANGHTTRYEYDALGNRTRIINALGHVTTYAYEPMFSHVTDITDANGRVTHFQYDARGNRTRETDPLGNSREWSYDARGNVITETDKRGTVTRYEYDSLGSRTRIIEAAGLPEQRETRLSYDAVGNLTARTDPNNHTAVFQYDSLNRLIRETDPLGGATQTFYDAEGNRAQVIDANGNATTFQYDLRRRLIRTIDALGQTTSQTYDGNGNRSTLTDKNGHTTRFEYDSQNRLIRTTDALGNVSTRSYDPVGNVLAETDANNHTTRYEYDPLNRLINKTDGAGANTVFEYDRVGLSGCPECTGPTKGSSLVTKQTDGNGKVTYFKYDGLDRLILEIRKQGDTSDVIGPDDAVTRFRYDPNGNRQSVTEPNSNTTTSEYDGLNRRTRETNPAGDTTRFEYDGVGNVIRIFAPNGTVTSNTYDAKDRLIQVADLVGLSAAYAYDPVGNRLSKADGNLNTTQFRYDSVNRLVQTVDPLRQGVVFSEYDPVGNLIRVIDRESHQTVYTYDDINRRVRSVDALGNATNFQYDGVGNLTRIVDANGNRTEYDYDGVNRVTKETYANGRLRTFSYDFVGNLQSRTDPSGQTILYTHNDLYFLTRRAYPMSPADNFTYDLSGRMLSAERGGWLVTFQYDGANRVTRTTQDGRIVNYVYDIPGRTRTMTYPGGRVITEQTDFRSRLDHIDELGITPSIVRYTYDLGDRVAARTFRNGTTANYSYNANNWVLELEHKFGATQIADFVHEHDKEGNKKFEAKRHDTNHSEAYQYDGIYRLVDFKVGELIGSTVPVPITQTQYNLDPVGNWSSKVKDGVTETRTHDAVNEITTINGVAILYDNNGNLTEDDRFRYAYDEENRLVRAARKSDSQVVGQYQYDALGRRVVKIATPTVTPIETRYFYDDARIIEEQNNTGTTQATYVYGNYVDEVLSMDRGGQTFFYHPNTLWSVAAISDSSAAVVERYSYDAYGCATPTSTVGNPYLFTGRQLDEETGLYFYRARYYDCAKGRFLQRDPLEYVDGMNLYEYSRGNPVFWVDPFGTQQETPLKFPLGNPADAGTLTKEVSEKLVKWLKDDCNIDPQRPSKTIRVSFPKCTPALDIVSQILPEGFAKCVLGKVTKELQKTRLAQALAAAVTIAGYFNAPDAYGLDREGEYCGYIEITKELSFKNSEKPPIIISRAFWLVFDVQLNRCNGSPDVHKKFRLDLLKWEEEFKEEPVKIGGDGPRPPQKPGDPVRTK